MFVRGNIFFLETNIASDDGRWTMAGRQPVWAGLLLGGAGPVFVGHRGSRSRCSPFRDSICLCEPGASGHADSMDGVAGCLLRSIILPFREVVKGEGLGYLLGNERGFGISGRIMEQGVAKWGAGHSWHSQCRSSGLDAGYQDASGGQGESEHLARRQLFAQEEPG